MSAAKMVADSTQAELTDAADGKKKKKRIKKGGKKVVLPEDEDSDLDLKRDLRPIGDFVKDRPVMIREMFRAVRGASLARALPDLLKSIPLDELQLLCQEQLEVMSKKRIRRILAGEESANISSSGTEDDTSDDEATQANGQPFDDATEGAVPDKHPADSTSLNQDSPRPMQKEELTTQQQRRQQGPQYQQPQQQQRQQGPLYQQPQQPLLPTQPQQPSVIGYPASIPLPVPIEHVKQEPPDSDDEQKSRNKSQGQPGQQKEGQNKPQSPAQLKQPKNYRRRGRSRDSSYSRSSSRSSRSSRSTRSSSSSRSSSYSSDSSRGGRRRRRKEGSSRKDKGSRRKGGKKRGGRRGRRRDDDSYSDEDRYSGGPYGGGAGVGRGRGLPLLAQPTSKVPGPPQQPESAVPAGSPPLDDDPELYTSGSEDGELVRKEVSTAVPPGVKIKTEPMSDPEAPGEEQTQQQQHQEKQQPQQQQRLPDIKKEQEQPELCKDQQPFKETAGVEHNKMEVGKQDQEQEDETNLTLEQSKNQTEPTPGTRDKTVVESHDGGEKNEQTDELSSVIVSQEESSTDKGNISGLEPGIDNKGNEKGEDDDWEEEKDDEDDDEDDDDDEGDGEVEETEEGSTPATTKGGKRAGGEKEMDQMELLELEMRARAIKAMLGDAEKKTQG